jgi:radical SAM superfamily enzyme YgiQ (UPF0313 family)
MTISKIMLVYPNFKWSDWMRRTLWELHPYNLCLLSAMIDKKYDVKIVDASKDDLTEEKFAELIKIEKPDIVGISVLTNEYQGCGLIAAKTAKKVDKNIKIIMGGVNATSIPLSLIKDTNVDYVVVGEGEYVFKELCDYFNGDCELPKKGIVYKKNGEVIDTGRADFIENLDDLPLPSYHKVDFMKYADEIQRVGVDRARDLPYAHIVTSRGCPFDCCFCETDKLSGKKFRSRSPENVIAEIDFLIKNYGIKTLIFDDDNLLNDKERAKKLFRLMISRKLKWMSQLAIYKLDHEMVELMKESGCQYVNPSFESGVQRVLNEIINKPLNLDHGKKMVQKLKQFGIDVAVNFVIGFPGETWLEIRQSLKFAEELGADYIKIFIATPLSNTRLYEVAKKQKQLVKDFSFEKHPWTDGCIETKDFRPQDLKILRAYEWDRINFSNPIKKKKVLEMMGVSEKVLDEIRQETFMRANP